MAHKVFFVIGRGKLLLGVGRRQQQGRASLSSPPLAPFVRDGRYKNVSTHSSTSQEEESCLEVRKINSNVKKKT